MGRPPSSFRADRRTPGARRPVRLERFAFDHHFAAAHDGRDAENARIPHVIRYTVGDNRVDLARDDGATSSLWWATKNERLGLAEVAGLEVEALYGGFAGEPFTDNSHEYVFVTRKPGR